MNIIGVRILVALAMMGKDLQWLLKESECDPDTLRYVMDNPGGRPTKKTIATLSRVLDVTPAWLTTDAFTRQFGQSETDSLVHCVHVIRTTMRGERKDGRGEPNARLDARRRLPDLFRGSGARSVVRVIGDSLMLFGLLDGDLVYVKPAHRARPLVGRLVLFKLNDELHLRRLTVSAGSKVHMHSGHHDYDPIHLTKADDVAILGEVVGSIRESNHAGPKQRDRARRL